jgi:hypothetical protein
MTIPENGEPILFDTPKKVDKPLAFSLERGQGFVQLASQAREGL